MCERNNQALFFTCSLIEQLGRTLNQKRSQVVADLNEKGLQAIYGHTDVLHCEPIEKVADDVIREFGLKTGVYNNVSTAKYTVPDVWTVGKIYARLIEDISQEHNVVETLMQIYTSWIDEAISDYNTSFYYQPRDYIAESYRQGRPVAG